MVEVLVVKERKAIPVGQGFGSLPILAMGILPIITRQPTVRHTIIMIRAVRIMAVSMAEDIPAVASTAAAVGTINWAHFSRGQL